MCGPLSQPRQGKRCPCLGTAHRREPPTDLFLCFGQSVGNRKGGCPHLSLLLSACCRKGWSCLRPAPLIRTSSGPSWRPLAWPSLGQPPGGTSPDTTLEQTHYHQAQGIHWTSEHAACLPHIWVPNSSSVIQNCLFYIPLPQQLFSPHFRQLNKVKKFG